MQKRGMGGVRKNLSIPPALLRPLGQGTGTWRDCRGVRPAFFPHEGCSTAVSKLLRGTRRGQGFRKGVKTRTTTKSTGVETESGSRSGNGGGDAEDGTKVDRSAGLENNVTLPDESANFAPGVAALLASSGRSAGTFPTDFSAALVSRRVSKEILERYLEMETQAFTGLLFRIAGFRERMVIDPNFLYKMALELGIGIVAKSTAEYGRRGDAFSRELDFVLANVIMAILADFLLVWLSAPSLTYRSPEPAREFSRRDVLTRWWTSLPDNAFQVVQPGMQPFSAEQRLSAFLLNGSKLFGIGLVCSVVGVGTTNALVTLREQMDSSFKNFNPPQDLVKTSAAYAAYLAVSANLRYQIVAGVIEERGIEAAFKGKPQLCKALSTVARCGNSLLGSLLWVDFVRFLGMQSSDGVDIRR